uniref:Uncharacterized protein n=1 Tax=Magallana gigas TaxID=29159 RepID=K1RPX6_MAGGI
MNKFSHLFSSVTKMMVKEREKDTSQHRQMSTTTTFLLMIRKYVNGLLTATNLSMFIHVKCNTDDVVNKQSNMNSARSAIVSLTSATPSSPWTMEGVITSRPTQPSATARDTTNT